MRKIGTKRHIISMNDFATYSTEISIAGDSGARKRLLVDITPCEKFMCFHIEQNGEIVETFGTLSDAIDFYNTL